MQRLLKVLKKALGKNLTNRIRPLGHGLKSYLAALYFGFPSKRLKLIGITSTKGKTTTTMITGRLMNLGGFKTGYLSTAVINLTGEEKDEFVNNFKMTTIDGFWFQKYLKQMADNGCQYVILEMSSQGLEQNRHWGLRQFLVAIFMNLYPEHLEAHGGLENYIKSKARLFQNLDLHGFFINSQSKKQAQNSELMWESIDPKKRLSIKRVDVREEDFEILNQPNNFYKTLNYKQKTFYTNFIADFEVENLIYAIKTVEIFKPNLVLSLQLILSKLSAKIPGRMDFVIKDNQIVANTNPEQAMAAVKSSISIMVDYAHEPRSLEKLLENLIDWKNRGYYTDIIHILSSDGAGRDDWKKPVMGELSFRNADYTIITTDNYDATDNPQTIIDLLSQSIPPEKIFSKDLVLENLDSKKIVQEIDRTKAFKQALVLAKFLVENKDRPEVATNFYRKILIVSTGVGSEFGLTQPNGVVEWNEKNIWIQEFKAAFSSQVP